MIFRRDQYAHVQNPGTRRKGDPVLVKVYMRSDLNDLIWTYASGETVDEAVARAEDSVSGDYAMEEWEPAHG